MERGSRISVPVIPYTFQVETELITKPNDDFIIILSERGQDDIITDKINLQIDVIGNKFIPITVSASFPETERNDWVIANSGTGIWTIKVSNAHIEFLLDGELVTSCDDA